MSRELARRALVAGLTVLSVVFGAGAAAQAAVKAPPAPLSPGSSYLALGDSVTFGYEEPTVVPAPNYKDAASFIGYPEILGTEFHVKVVNAACPGETTASFISTFAASLACENTPTNRNTGYRKLFPLHVAYKPSQLNFAVKYLQTHRRVGLVSLMIGANDGFRCQQVTPDHCTSPSEQKAVLETIGLNVHRILSALRNRAHYHGTIAIVNYWSLNYASAVATAQSLGINAAVDAAAKPFHVRLADGFGEFKHQATIFGGDTCAAGLLTDTHSPPCGVHPSYAGQSLLALAVTRALRL